MRRRQLRTSLSRIAPAILSIALVLSLGACATPPPPDRAAVQQQALRKLGFVEAGADWIIADALGEWAEAGVGHVQLNSGPMDDRLVDVFIEARRRFRDSA